MIVLDSSAAVEIIRQTPEGKALAQLMLSGELVLSTKLFCSEVCNTFCEYGRAEMIDESTALECIEKALRLVDQFYEVDEFYREALHESLRFDYPVYGLLYFCLARHKNATLFTLDQKLATLAEREGVACVRKITL